MCAMGRRGDVTEVADGLARARVARSDLEARVIRVTQPIIDAIEKGNFPSTAAQAAGIPARTWSQWRTWADEGDVCLIELFEQVACALAKAEMELVSKLTSPPQDAKGSADAGWIRSTQFLLERTRRERWGEKVEVKLRVEDSMRELLDELQGRMSAEAFNELVLAMSEIDSGDA
jgi:ParB-like chromosome segregation protein Spo0J